VPAMLGMPEIQRSAVKVCLYDEYGVLIIQKLMPVPRSHVGETVIARIFPLHQRPAHVPAIKASLAMLRLAARVCSLLTQTLH
jgi:hypothetical protein